MSLACSTKSIRSRVANAMVAITRSAWAISEDDLYAETLAQFGWKAADRGGGRAARLDAGDGAPRPVVAPGRRWDDP